MGYALAESCDLDGGTPFWDPQPCPSGTSCINGACSDTCTDQCNLGDQRTADGGVQTCVLFDTGARGAVDAGSGMADRSRGYNAWLRKWGLAEGQVTYMEYSGPDLQTITGYNDQGDSAIFTGTYLAAEAWRAQVTGSPDALQNVTNLVHTLHTLWSVANSPGWLARYAVPASDPPIITSAFSTSDPYSHYDAGWEGGSWDWLGHVSRDQYQGVVLGYSIAYDALTDESVRDIIRGDMVTFVNELMKVRTICPTIDSIPCLVPTTIQYAVVTDQEPLNIEITTDSSGNTTAALTGIQDFTPMLLGLYPQATAAIQLAAAFQVAMQVTANEPAWASQYQTIQSFYDANVDSWLQVAQLWSYSRDCGNSYFANNIAYEPMYNLARLETDPTRLSLIQGTILEQDMWVNGVSGDKNSWFAYIYSADAPAGSSGAAPAATLGTQQLEQFGDPPRVHVAVNNNLPADPSCPGNALDSIDVGQRVIGDFLWQRGSWQESDPGNPSEVYPGVDYLAAYWLGRAKGYLTDDTPSQCTQWSP